MKENRYDDAEFFAKYSQFPRSVAGLSAAGEWHALRAMLPDFAGKRVLDIGCGMGWHCRYAAEHGAAYVLGTDISAKMLDAARAKSGGEGIAYRQVAMEDLDFAAGSFDVVMSSLAFHYTPDFEGMARKVAGFLARGGDFVFSAEHPVFTAYGTQAWIEDAAGEKLYWPVDRYFMPGAREAVFLGERVTKFHRTVTAYVRGVLQAGFEVLDLVEPEPAAELLDAVEGMRDELRRPMMLLVKAKKR